MENLLFRAAFWTSVATALCYGVGAIFSRPRWALAGRAAMGGVALTLSAGLTVRWLAAGRPPFSNLYESLLVFAWALALIFLVLEWRYALQAAGGIVGLLSALMLIYASRLDPAIHPLMPALQSRWLIAHVLTCFIGYAASALSCVCGLLVLHALRRRRTDDAARLDTALYRSIALGFLCLTLGLITGAVWANRAWGRYWGWDPKETWALITWFVYAFYLHMHAVRGWRGRRGAWLALAGFAAVLFTYFGVSYLLPGLHSYAAP